MVVQAGDLSLIQIKVLFSSRRAGTVPWKELAATWVACLKPPLFPPFVLARANEMIG